MTDGRLTYTSVDTLGAGQGGWQVRQEHDLTAVDRARALELVATAMDPVGELPRFPSEAEVRALPHRLVVGTTHDSTLLVNSAPAGPDASGRPGNVFNHVVAVHDLLGDLLSDTEAPVPVQLWRSPDWLHPWGPDAVRTSDLPAVRRPRPGGVVTRGSVAALLSDPTAAPGVGALLDAVAAAVSGTGLPVVVLVDTQDRGALWLGAAALLAGPAFSARFTFSTWERAYAVRTGAELPHVSLMPRDDEAHLHGLDVVVLDPDAQHPVACGAWPSTDPRRPVAVTPWSALAAGVCGLGSGQVADRLLAVAELSALNPRVARSEYHLLFALALAVAEDELAGSEVAADVLRSVPPWLVSDPTTRADLERLVGADVTAAERAQHVVELLEHAPDDGAAVDLATRDWLQRLLSEQALVQGPWPAVLPAVSEALTPAGRQGLADVLSQALPMLLPQPLGPEDTAVALLRVLDLAALLDVDELLPGEIVASAADLAVALLADPLAGPAAVRRAGQLAASTATLLRAPLGRITQGSTARPGERLPAHLRGWAHAALVGSVPDDDSPLLVELLLFDPSERAYQQRRAAVARQLLTAVSPPPAIEDVAAVLALVGQGTLWTAPEAVWLHDKTGLDLTAVALGVLEAEPFGSPPAAAFAAQVRAGALGPLLQGSATAHLVALHLSLSSEALYGESSDTTEDERLADVVIAGTAYALGNGRTPAGLSAATNALVAAVRLHARESGRGSALSGDRLRRLGGTEGDLPLLLPRLAEAVPALLSALTDEREALLLFGAVARATFPSSFARSGPTQLWLHPVDPQVHGRSHLGEALLQAYIATRSDGGAWVESATRLSGYEEDGARRIRDWARDLVSRSSLTTTTAHPIDAPVPEPFLGSVPRPSPDVLPTSPHGRRWPLR